MGVRASLGKTTSSFPAWMTLAFSIDWRIPSALSGRAASRAVPPPCAYTCVDTASTRKIAIRILIRRLNQVLQFCSRDDVQMTRQLRNRAPHNLTTIERPRDSAPKWLHCSVGDGTLFGDIQGAFYPGIAGSDSTIRDRCTV